MGRQIYLSEKELYALRTSAEEWCSIMSEGTSEECRDAVSERLDNGLGSALFKLYKGRNGEEIYINYAFGRADNEKISITKHKA